MEIEELQEWAAKLSDEQLTMALYELRDRGHAVACYGKEEFAALFDGELDKEFDLEDFMQEHRAGIEDDMCEVARQYFIEMAGDAFIEEDKADEPAKLWGTGNADSD